MQDKTHIVVMTVTSGRPSDEVAKQVRQQLAHADCPFTTTRVQAAELPEHAQITQVTVGAKTHPESLIFPIELVSSND